MIQDVMSQLPRLHRPLLVDKLQAQTLVAVGARPLVSHQRKAVEAAIGVGDSHKLKLEWYGLDAYSSAARA